MPVKMPEPRTPESLGLVGKASKTVRTHPAPIQPVKHVAFNKDIITKKMSFFTDLVTHFNKIKDDESGGHIAVRAKEWLAKQMADDIYSELRLHHLEWEFETAAKLNEKKKKDNSLDSILLDEKVEDFMRKLDIDAFHIDLDEEVVEKPKVSSGRPQSGRQGGSKVIKAVGKVKQIPPLHRPNDLDFKIRHTINGDSLAEKLQNILKSKKKPSKKPATKPKLKKNDTSNVVVMGSPNRPAQEKPARKPKKKS
jgi:hypothetical protein